MQWMNAISLEIPISMKLLRSFVQKITTTERVPINNCGRFQIIHFEWNSTKGWLLGLKFQVVQRLVACRKKIEAHSFGHWNSILNKHNASLTRGEQAVYPET
jgi:hypothetical protein